MRQIKSNRGISILVDDEDYEMLSKYNWHVTAAGYARTRDGYSHRTMHSMLIECPSGFVRDHIDRNKLNNQKKNLRIISSNHNSQNRSIRKKGSSKYKGVSKHIVKQKKRGIVVTWVSSIMANGKKYPSKSFKTEIEAAKHYNKMAKKLHGKFAVLNSVK